MVCKIVINRKWIDFLLRCLNSKLVAWSVYVSRQKDENVFGLTDPVFSLTLPGRENLLSDVCLYADPFLFVKDGYLWLFCERMKRGGHGHIVAYKTSDLIHWIFEGVVLERPFHLSYPNVFKYKGDVYMLPETSKVNEVALYRAMDFPRNWEKICVLLSGKPYSDSSVIYHQGMWYLFTSPSDDKLCLFVSKNLLSDSWKEHPCSPVFSGLKGARGGGSVFKEGNTLYRMGQDDEKSYANNVAVYMIDLLTENDYHESLVIPELFDHTNKRYQFGGHHFCRVKFKNETLIATDGIIKARFINRIRFYLEMLIFKIKRSIDGRKYRFCRK